MNIKIDDEFKSLIPPLSEDEYCQLEDNLLRNGIREPLSIWGEVLIDGHNRFKIAQKHKLTYETKQYDFENRNTVIEWIIKNQFGRRNLTAYDRTILALRLKPLIAERARENQVKSGGAVSQNSVEPVDTQKELAKIANVSHDTIAKVEKIEKEATPEVKQLLRDDSISINQANDLIKLSCKQQEEILPYVERGKSIDKTLQEVKIPHVAHNGGNNEWYTPKEYIDIAKIVMGDIELDPASSDIANNTVQARKYYTIESNGLNREWKGKVWLNPPYSSDLIHLFIDKLKYHYENGDVSEAIVLVNNATETAWFGTLTSVAKAAVFPRQRVKFHSPDGRIAAPLQGQAILYIGENETEFIKQFAVFGWGCRIER